MYFFLNYWKKLNFNTNYINITFGVGFFHISFQRYIFKLNNTRKKDENL